MLPSSGETLSGSSIELSRHCKGWAGEQYLRLQTSTQPYECVPFAFNRNERSDRLRLWMAPQRHNYPFGRSLASLSQQSSDDSGDEAIGNSVLKQRRPFCRREQYHIGVIHYCLQSPAMSPSMYGRDTQREGGKAEQTTDLV